MRIATGRHCLHSVCRSATAERTQPGSCPMEFVELMNAVNLREKRLEDSGRVRSRTPRHRRLHVPHRRWTPAFAPSCSAYFEINLTGAPVHASAVRCAQTSSKGQGGQQYPVQLRSPHQTGSIIAVRCRRPPLRIERNSLSAAFPKAPNPRAQFPKSAGASHDPKSFAESRPRKRSEIRMRQ